MLLLFQYMVAVVIQEVQQQVLQALAHRTCQLRVIGVSMSVSDRYATHGIYNRTVSTYTAADSDANRILVGQIKCALSCAK